MRRTQMLPILAAGSLIVACSKSVAGPTPLDVVALGGTYHITLSSAGPRSCTTVDVVVAADTVTWQSTGCGTPPNYLSRTAGGTRRVGPQEIALDVWMTVGVGTDSVASETFTFDQFTGSTQHASSDWLGPCTIPFGGGVGCKREAGTANWARQ